jgi:hypothetical protein
MKKIEIITNQLTSENIFEQHQGFDNITCFTHPSNFKERTTKVIEKLNNIYPELKESVKKSLVKNLLYLAIAIDGGYELNLNLKDEKRHKEKILKEEDLKYVFDNLLQFLKEFEMKEKEIFENSIREEKERLSKILSGKGLFGYMLRELKDFNVSKFLEIFTNFNKKSNLKKLREESEGLIGVDYGIGVREARILWGADLVMMNPTLALLALNEDDELKEMFNRMLKEKKGKLSQEELVREATKIAGFKARLALRSVFLLKGRGKVSFQVNPRTYNQPEKLERDIRILHKEFNEECLKYDEGLFLEEVLTEKEIKERKGKSHVFYKVDGSNKSIYGEIEKLLLEQISSNKFDISEGDSNGVLERVLADGMNCNVTVAGFLTDGLYSFFCQIRGHSKARKKGIPTTHSIITKMGGRVEAALRWIAIQKLYNSLKEKNNPKAEEVLEIKFAENGSIDQMWVRELAKEAGFVLPEEISSKDYKKYRGKIFPTDSAICIIGEAISKRSHRIISDLKNHPILKTQGVLEDETGDLQASMRPPYKDRFSHVEELVGIYAQGHFPNIALEIEKREKFEISKNNIEKPAPPEKIEELYNSIISEDFAKVYEVDESLKKVLQYFKIYREEYGEKGIKIEEFCKHPFAQQTLFGKYLGEKIPETEEEKDKIDTGFVGDYNKLAKMVS